jgi:hypothetical protein
MGWYDGEARRLESAEPPDGKYLPDEPASFARSMNSSVKRNLFRLPNSGLSSCLATHAVELVGMKCTSVLGHSGNTASPKCHCSGRHHGVHDGCDRGGGFGLSDSAWCSSRGL